MKTVILLSGGMDSTVALWHTLAEGHEVVACLGVDYASKHNAKELPMARWQAEKAGVPFQTADLTFMNQLFQSDLLQSGGEIPEGHYEEENMKSTVVPFRNGILLAVAAGFAESVEAEGLVIAAHSGDHAIYPDCREDFLAPMAQAIAAGTYADVSVLRPFVALRKEDIASRGAELGVDFTHTWSCYKGGDIHCGKCGTCVERKEAFAIAQLEDPTVYLA
ncbi:7-cyano-7-deazaguanine synthase QueC [Roseibacillus persicicus]|uniref:7-cyano-7-deazaguanine synthase QueC n=1 Tax=Roseibacillus persicicus TaxID=454148 RepID=UPI00280F27F3|nr:7-cyano-7-deazaguanine synthase QueC [Roseibacillus persicicus]MDQ8188734.1 7-cyano-7-deazaguanine synthase QueC [Roseibacillus persicicus]